ncbi:caspase family protein, partial [Providencia vermicola]
KGMSSYYTKSLVKNIKNYNLTINEVFSRTREDVINYSDFSQIPWEYSSLQEINNFSFDNIKVPNKLIRIAKSQFSDALAINSDEFGFYIGGQGNFIEVFDKTRESCEKINFNMVDERIDIECISKNENHMIVLMERGEVVIFELKKMKKKKPF